MQLTAMSYSERLAFIEVDSGLSGDTVSVSASPRCFVGTDTTPGHLLQRVTVMEDTMRFCLCMPSGMPLKLLEKGKQVCERWL
mmetsp:Transcript_32787/g.63079  ORF Transcript_32787/g.63079 Transcript_32787/m.63079 type:complete len:83 (+) Transcript_32787:403-651(+)